MNSKLIELHVIRREMDGTTTPKRANELLRRALLCVVKDTQYQSEADVICGLHINIEETGS